MNASDILFYTTPQGEVRIEVFFEDETFWLTQKKLAELFDVEVNTINYHLKEIFQSGELQEEAVVRKIRITASDGTFQWVRMITTGQTFDTAGGLAIDAADNVFMTGSFGDSVVFDVGPLATFYSNNSSTAFTMKYGVDLSTGTAEAPTADDLHLMPNPTNGWLTVTGAFERGDLLHVLDPTGRLVMRVATEDHLLRLSLHGLPAGTYTLL